MVTKWWGAVWATAFLIAWGAAADTITLDDATHHRVVVSETASLYYVQFPEKGTVVSVLKDQVSPDSVRISSNHAEREQLKRLWRENHNARRENLVSASDASAVTPLGKAPVSTSVSAGKSTAPTRSSETQSSVISPKQRSTANNTAAGPRSPAHSNPYVSSYGSNQAGMGGGNRWGNQYGGGQYGPGQYREEGYGGGYGGGQYGGGRSTGGGRAGHFGNISELFSTIDDRLVGETPAQIGIRGAYTPYGNQYGGGQYGSQQYERQYNGGRSVGGQFGGGQYSGGYGGGQYGQGGYGGGGYGGGGYGGGGYGGGGRPGHFGNISELFSTIDDRLVGETPAIIGPTMLRY